MGAVASRALLIIFALGANDAVQAAAPLELRVVADNQAFHLVLPPEAPKQRSKREALELDAWDVLGPLQRAAKKPPPLEVLRDRFVSFARQGARIVSNASLHYSESAGLDALSDARRMFRQGPRTAEQVAVWQRAELSPAADIITVRYALLSYAKDKGVADTKFTLEWHSQPQTGATPAERASAWIREDAAPFKAALEAAIGTLLAAFELARQDALAPTGAQRGTIRGQVRPLTLLQEQAERVLAIGDDDDLHSVPRTEWTPAP